MCARGGQVPLQNAISATVFDLEHEAIRLGQKAVEIGYAEVEKKLAAMTPKMRGSFPDFSYLRNEKALKKMSWDSSSTVAKTLVSIAGAFKPKQIRRRP